MSVYRDSIQAFIKILDSQSNSLSLQDWNELEELSRSLADDDDKKVSEKIQKWLQAESRQQISLAHKKELRKFSHSINLGNDLGLDRIDTPSSLRGLGIGGVTSPTPPNQPSPSIRGIGGAKSPTPPNQSSPSTKELLDNAIERNSPLSDNIKPKEKP